MQKQYSFLNESKIAKLMRNGDISQKSIDRLISSGFTPKINKIYSAANPKPGWKDTIILTGKGALVHPKLKRYEKIDPNGLPLVLKGTKRSEQFRKMDIEAKKARQQLRFRVADKHNFDW